jgi:hypothetical protein
MLISQSQSQRQSQVPEPEPEPEPSARTRIRRQLLLELYGVADSNIVPFGTEGAAVYMNEGVPLLRSGRSETHSDFGDSNVDPTNKYGFLRCHQAKILN